MLPKLVDKFQDLSSIFGYVLFAESNWDLNLVAFHLYGSKNDTTYVLQKWWVYSSDQNPIDMTKTVNSWLVHDGILWLMAFLK